MIERCLAPICSGITDRGPRSEGAAAVLFEAEESASRRGARILARVAFWGSWRGTSRPVMPPPPPRAAAIFFGREDDRLRRALEGSPWAEVPRHGVAARAGDHEGAGGFAGAAAVSALAAGEVDAALVIGVAKDRGYAVLLERVSQAGGHPQTPA